MIQPLKKLFKALDNASEMIVLKEWLEYLKKNQYKCNVDELKKIAKSMKGAVFQQPLILFQPHQSKGIPSADSNPDVLQ